MSSTWFKFYGQEFLCDPKMMSLTITEKTLWITLLCLSSSAEIGGTIKYVDEYKIKILAGMKVNDENWIKTENFLDKFKKLGMITIDNGIIFVNNWKKKQKRAMTGYERLKKYREKKKQQKHMITEPSLSKDNGFKKIVIKNEANDNGDNDDDNGIEVDKNIYNINIGKSPIINPPRENIKTILKNYHLPCQRINSISTSWQNQAFMDAEYMGIKLDNKYKSRFLKVYKDAFEGRKTGNISTAKSYVKDHPTLITSESKILMFFKIYENGAKPFL